MKYIIINLSNLNVQQFLTIWKLFFNRMANLVTQNIYNVNEIGLPTEHVPPKIQAPKATTQLGSKPSGERG